MTKQNRQGRTAAAAARTQQTDMPAFDGPNGMNLGAMMKAQGAVLDGIAAVTGEMASFANRRLACNVERSQDLMNCEDLDDAMQVNYRFAQSTAEQYLEEASKLTLLTMKAAADYWTPIAENTWRAANGGKV